MNYNAAVYSNAVSHLNDYYHITNARHGMIGFLVTYAFGCELWAPCEYLLSNTFDTT